MQVTSNYYNSNIQFKANLHPKIRQNINNIDVKHLEDIFLEYGVKCNFKGDKPIAGGMALAINICQEAFDRFSLPFHYLPPSIQVFSKKELIDKKDNECFGFCTWGNIPVLKKQEESQLGSIYINSFPHNNDMSYFDKIADRDFRNGRLSTDHFIGRFLHELFHNIHLNILIDKHGIDACYDEYGNGILKDTITKGMSIKDKFTAVTSVSQYASKSYLELFSEILTKITTESLDSENLTLKNNPMDNLKKLPASLNKFIKQELN